MEKILEMYKESRADTHAGSSFRLHFDGEPVQLTDTLEGLGVEDEDQLDVVVQES
jgi:hypothetical protein